MSDIYDPEAHMKQARSLCEATAQCLNRGRLDPCVGELSTHPS